MNYQIFYRQDLLVMVSRDSGITPFISIIYEIIYANETQKCKIQHKKGRVFRQYVQLNPSYAPITPISVENNWLWLGSIISVSFIIYLMFIGILMQYYIYLIDHNTNKIYSSSSRAVLNILFIGVCIFITSMAAFLWNKRKNANETTQIQNMEDATPMASPNSCLCNADRELESLTQ